jgi:hypothetical protein
LQKGWVAIDRFRLEEIVRSFELLSDTSCGEVKIGKDDTCSFFLYPYLMGYELFEKEDPDPGFETWSRDVYRHWVLFLAHVKKLENNGKKQSS